MELSEAERVLLDMINLINLLGYEQKEKANLKYENSTYREAIDTVLKALDNSISKEYHDMAIKEQNDIINDLKDRLDNSVSKDYIKLKYEDYKERIRYYDDNNIKQDDIYHEYISICDVLVELLGE